MTTQATSTAGTTPDLLTGPGVRLDPGALAFPPGLPRAACVRVERLA